MGARLPRGRPRDLLHRDRRGALLLQPRHEGLRGGARPGGPHQARLARRGQGGLEERGRDDPRPRRRHPQRRLPHQDEHHRGGDPAGIEPRHGPRRGRLHAVARHRHLQRGRQLLRRRQRGHGLHARRGAGIRGAGLRHPHVPEHRDAGALLQRAGRGGDPPDDAGRRLRTFDARRQGDRPRRDLHGPRGIRGRPDPGRGRNQGVRPARLR